MGGSAFDCWRPRLRRLAGRQLLRARRAHRQGPVAFSDWRLYRRQSDQLSQQGPTAGGNRGRRRADGVHAGMTQKSLFVGVTLLFALSGQETRPSCNRCSATYISNQEIEQYLKRGTGNAVSDQQVRAVDAGKTNVDVGVVYRGKLTGESLVAEHDLVSEVYHIIDGSATLVTGPDID